MLKRPHISEKSMNLAKLGLYTFEVDRNATKMAIAKLIEEKFKVDVVSVKSVNVKGKTKLQRSKKGYFQTTPIKKAFIQVKKGQKITLFEQASEPEPEVVTGDEPVVKEKKGRFGGPKVKIEKESRVKGPESSEKKKEEPKKKTAKQKSIAEKKGSK